ncbi:MAG TPA: aldo/keto reductase [Lachnoclostridium phocaeense]|uniref:Aldo/keto reductase n=1 Tax=Lachnoclostridium phocaeense TaxID=1871021 RepID=A0A921LFH7_9FIRM|nr:aldo/keto reductase [Lachnoclostridium phocaeense]
MHFGAEYRTGKYGWTLSLERIKKSVDWQLKNLKTDYIDFGFVHCIDEEADLRKVLEGGTLDYMKQLKEAGVMRHIGLSFHTPGIVNRMLDTGLIDMVMFSINPAYDYRHGDYAIGTVDERTALYRRCEAEGVGISVMKAFGGGQLLNAGTSPFGQALSEYQCIQYALDKPGVLTVLPGLRGTEDLRRLLGFFEAAEEEKDYSVLGSFAPREAEGVCVYCNHCQPCPSGLDVGLINKYYDLAMAGDALARNHYLNLEMKASSCTGCGHCDRRCPFQVKQTERMKEIRDYFGV